MYVAVEPDVAGRVDVLEAERRGEKDGDERTAAPRPDFFAGDAPRDGRDGPRREHERQDGEERRRRDEDGVMGDPGDPAAAEEELEVLVKVIDAAEGPFIVGVTICTNKQNPVDPWNLRASEQIQLDLADRFREELGIFYERQEKSWESYRLADLEEIEVDGNQKPIQIRPLAQTFLAVQGELDRMSRLGDVFEDEKVFRRTFPESYLRVDPRKIVLVYKIHLRRRALMRHLAEHKGPSFEFIQRGWNLVQALLVQALFNHKDLSSWLDRFGTTTSMETDYTEVLRSLLLSKVVPVIKRTASESPYAESLGEGKYAFLRTKAFFGKCMDQAENDYGWEKRSF